MRVAQGVRRNAYERYVDDERRRDAKRIGGVPSGCGGCGRLCRNSSSTYPDDTPSSSLLASAPQAPATLFARVIRIGSKYGAAVGTTDIEVQIEKSVKITNKYGLHARPAMQFVEIASRFASDVRLARGETCADAKSIMEVLMLAAENGADLVIKADGEDAEAAVEALTQLVATKFDEE